MATQGKPSVLDDRTTGFATHEVMNQPGALEDYDAYSEDKPLVEAVRVFGAEWATDHPKRAGAWVGSEKVQTLARQANRHLPELRAQPLWSPRRHRRVPSRLSRAEPTGPQPPRRQRTTKRNCSFGSLKSTSATPSGLYTS